MAEPVVRPVRSAIRRTVSGSSSAVGVLERMTRNVESLATATPAGH
ncbi:hypothetical protein [Streptomyces huiliensis]|nr:hypothetical protein [Streptomyces huiliensis]MBZ4318610.1 hypothetical protein [Streptomyces huiliensis]